MSGLGKELRSVILIIDSSNNYFCNYLIGFFLVYKMLKKPLQITFLLNDKWFKQQKKRFSKLLSINIDAIFDSLTNCLSTRGLSLAAVFSISLWSLILSEGLKYVLSGVFIWISSATIYIFAISKLDLLWSLGRIPGRLPVSVSFTVNKQIWLKIYPQTARSLITYQAAQNPPRRWGE